MGNRVAVAVAAALLAGTSMRRLMMLDQTPAGTTPMLGGIGWSFTTGS